MPRVIEFPSRAPHGPEFQRVRSSYSVREISRQFGISEQHVRRWARMGVIPRDPQAGKDEIRFDLRSLKLFRRIRELKSRGLSVRQIEAELHGQLNLFPDEGRLIQLPVRLSPFEEAVQLHECDDPRAEEAYRRAIDSGDAVCDAYCNLGILEFERGSMAAAFDRFTMALALDPRHFEAKFNLASLYFEAGELRLARLHFEQAARLEPDCFDCRFNLAVALAMDGNVQGAAEVLIDARAIATEDDLPRLERFLSTLESPPPP